MTPREAKGQRESLDCGVEEVTRRHWRRGRPAGWFVWDAALPRLLLADPSPSRLPASSLLSALPAVTHVDTSHYLLMAFWGSPWQHSHYLWVRGPLLRLLMQALSLRSLCISSLALIKSEGSQHCESWGSLNHTGHGKMSGVNLQINNEDMLESKQSWWSPSDVLAVDYISSFTGTFLHSADEELKVFI